MTNYEKLISYLPSIYQKENNLKLMQSIAILFDKFDKDLASIDKMWVVEEATGASTATISRVKRSLAYGADGYAQMLKRIEKEKEDV